MPSAHHMFDLSDWNRMLEENNERPLEPVYQKEGIAHTVYRVIVIHPAREESDSRLWRILCFELVIPFIDVDALMTEDNLGFDPKILKHPYRVSVYSHPESRFTDSGILLARREGHWDSSEQRSFLEAVGMSEVFMLPSDPQREPEGSHFSIPIRFFQTRIFLERSTQREYKLIHRLPQFPAAMMVVDYLHQCFPDMGFDKCAKPEERRGRWSLGHDGFP